MSDFLQKLEKDLDRALTPFFDDLNFRITIIEKQIQAKRRIGD